MKGINAHLYPSPMTTESRMLRIASALETEGYFSEILLVGQSGPGLPSVEEISAQVGIRRLGPPHGRGGARIGRLLALGGWGLAVWRELSRLPLTCINCHSLATLPLGVLLKWRTGARLIYDTHELETEVAGSTGWRRAIACRVERRLIAHVDHVFTVSEAISDWYRRAYTLRSVSTLLNVPPEAPSPQGEGLRVQLSFPEDATIFLYQGLLAPGRGLECLVDTFREWERPRTLLVLLGYGPLRDHLLERAGGSERVQVRDAVPPTELARFTQAADVGLSLIEPISLSYEYCMPNKLFEYLMAGKPVIVSPTVEQARFVRAHGTGVVAAAVTADAIRAAVTEVLALPPTDWASRCTTARTRVSWTAECDRLRSVYSGTLGFSS